MLRSGLLMLTVGALVVVGCGDDGGGDSTAAATPSPAAEKVDVESGAEDRAGERRRGAPRGKTIRVVDSQFGRVIADRRGEALYLFDREKGRRSRCYGACAEAWPPLLTKGRPRAGRGADAKLLGTTRRRDGRLQVTYNGHPVYYYVEDAPGRILCHNVDEFGGLWLVVDPRGDAVS